VVGKDVRRNIVYIEQGANHPALFSPSLVAGELSWVSTNPPSTPYACTAKIRYRQADQPCVIEKIENGTAYIAFLEPQRAVTPSQSIVFYDGTICLGGGVIH
jgi:tRNA-uridine 2-sulfurtransferase